MLLGGEQLAANLSTLTMAWSPKYGGDCLCWESAISFLKLSEHKELAESCHSGSGCVLIFSLF